jgi:hypothetical protein
MQPANNASLSALLRRAEPRGVSSGANGTVCYRDVLGGTSFADANADFADRNILLAVPDQLSAAPALIEPDAVAHDILLCPADIEPIHFAAIAADTDNDTVEPDAETQQRIIADILTGCRDALPDHKVPTKLHIVPRLEVSVSGKLKRHHA